MQAGRRDEAKGPDTQPVPDAARGCARPGTAHPRHAADPSPAYRLAFDDPDFLMRDELRPVRLQLELLKPEMLMAERGIVSTVVMFGGARIPAPGREGARTRPGACRPTTRRRAASPA
jgi:hypothetical protein